MGDNGKICVLKYPAGNVCSVLNALKRLGVEPLLTDDAEELRKASKVIIPGQGSAATVMQYLREHKLDELILSLKQPVLGICIGMQLLCMHSDEGDAQCLGVFDDALVEHFCKEVKHDEGKIKVPHMGWNVLRDMSSPLFDELDEGRYVYFVHSYRVKESKYAIAMSEYPKPFVAAMQRDNFYATQFHPEKSGDVGERIIGNFLKL